MKRNSLLSFTFIAAALLLGSQNLFTNNAQPPAGFTGAPGEQSCANSGCHAGTAAANAIDITLLPAGSPSLTAGYAASTQYSLAVNAGNGFQIYGFSLTAVDANGEGIGTFSLSSPANTSLATAGTKQYVGHKSASSSNAWTFKWTSPATTTDSVYFYLAVNQGNNNGANSGDNIRLRTYAATASSFGAFNTGGGTSIQNLDALVDGQIAVFPNPVSDNISLNFNLTENQPVKAGIYNLSGQLVRPLMDEELSWGEHDRNFNVAGSMSTGIYLVKFTVGSNDYFKKIVVE